MIGLITSITSNHTIHHRQGDNQATDNINTDTSTHYQHIDGPHDIDVP